MESSKTTTYTIEQVTALYLTIEKNYEDFVKYVGTTGPELSSMFENKLNWKNTALQDLVNNYIFLVCRRNGEMTGHMICFFTKTPLDPQVTILRQLSFYAKPDSGRTAYHLFHKFIDIGKKQANHIITMLTSHTNIKPSTLENLGFKELETLYRMEIK
jgi:hypothetical protein